MKNLNNLIFLSILIFIGCTNNNENDSIVDSRLSELLENKSFFKLQTELDSNQNELSEDRLLYYRTHCSHAFSDENQSSAYADLLLNKYKNQLNDTTIIELLDIKSSNYIQNYQYREASELYKLILEQHSDILDSSEIVSFKNIYQLFGALTSVKPQLIHKRNTVKISSHRNQFNHLMTPVKCGGMVDEFIFDTGANLSTISDSYAKKMGLTIYDSDINVGSSTHINIQTKLAVADSLVVGDILFENVVFLVAPDEQMSFPSINYEIHGIIGFPVIHQMNEIRIHRDGTITVPKESQDRKLHNMFMNGLNPVVQLLSNSDTLLFTMDTGAKNSELSKKYYNSHEDEVKKKGEIKTSDRGGAGGIVEAEEYILQHFPYKIGTKSNELLEIPVALTEYSFNKCFDGNLGQDVFTQFNEMIVNFQYMYVDFE